MQAGQMSELVLAIMLGLNPTLPISEQLAPDEVVIGYVKKGEGCMDLAKRLGYMVGPKRCEAIAKRLNRATVGFFVPNEAKPTSVDIVMYPGEKWAIRREKGRIVYFGPFANMNNRNK